VLFLASLESFSLLFFADVSIIITNLSQSEKQTKLSVELADFFLQDSRAEQVSFSVKKIICRF
jgi:hypothetical protein